MDNQIREFLEKSLVPTIKGLITVSKDLMDHQSKEHKNLIMAVNENTGKTQSTEDAVRILSECVSTLSAPLSELIQAVNESNRIQQEQTKILKENQALLLENTSRLDILNLSLAAKVEDPGITALYEKLKGRGGA